MPLCIWLRLYKKIKYIHAFMLIVILFYSKIISYKPDYKEHIILVLYSYTQYHNMYLCRIVARASIILYVNLIYFRFDLAIYNPRYNPSLILCKILNWIIQSGIWIYSQIRIYITCLLRIILIQIFNISLYLYDKYAYAIMIIVIYQKYPQILKA